MLQLTIEEKFQNYEGDSDYSDPSDYEDSIQDEGLFFVRVYFCFILINKVDLGKLLMFTKLFLLQIAGWPKNLETWKNLE